ncbi:chagasin peptidase inhibitor I42 family protein [Brevibacillus laterosporus GI-9]|uniref:protease inhibitor I42 family protein n=1 Tax=Brevibacillus laterosporus TaxID=1465 RepID=UPI0002405509|nr:protease inhibitor I42 family protein [Brevibacillus laterosporus]CCF17081.1 chagasin peptidase inhibitor I42 family protein [Brevibacillus laterosporus GI-9]
MVLTEQDSGQIIDISVGKIITVQLKENPTTGYRWTVETASGLEKIGDSYKPGGAGIGAAGLRIFQFKTIQVGSYELHLRNWVEWEGDSSIVDRFNVRINVE